MEENQKSSVFQKLGGAVKGFFKEWNVPAEHNTVPNKEIVAFAGGGMGVKILNAFTQQIQLTAGCLLVGSVYGLSPSNLFILSLISTIISILKTPLVSWLVDNTNTRWGKIRPYFLFAGLPLFIGVLGMVFLVPENGTVAQKMISIGIFYNIFAISQQIYNSTFTSMYQVISPNSGERNKIMSICEVVASLGPSILQLVLPVAAQLIYGDDALTMLAAYRLLLPIFAGIGFALGLVVMFMTNERTIVSKTAAKKVKFKDGMKFISKNREVWIVAISRFFSGFRGVLILLLGWLCLYSGMKNGSAMKGVYETIASVGYTPGMILAAFLMSKLGSKKAGFFAFFAQAIATLIILLTFKIHALFFVIMLLLYNLAQGPQFIIQSSITADALDEIQYETGERVEGFVQNFQVMIEIIGGLVSQLIFALIYEHFGLKEDANGVTDYNVLKDEAVRNPIFTWVLITVIIASILSALPFLLMKMNKQKHDLIIAELKKRELEDSIKDKNIEVSENETLKENTLEEVLKV